MSDYSGPAAPAAVVRVARPHYVLSRVGQPTEAGATAKAGVAGAVGAALVDEVQVRGPRIWAPLVQTPLRLGAGGQPFRADHDPQSPPEAHVADLRVRRLLLEPR
ncbi:MULTISPECIES: hypothetical protein [Micromonospora]|uniref:hypothetical protein n=1 Tax=Micromonospora TaxID=1873 RepID=UPI0033C2C43B